MSEQPGSVGLIWAQAANGVIGRDGTLPWELPEDLAHFAATTRGATVVMGRGTWESLPARVRPLPGRHNIVLTGQPDWQATGSTVMHSLVDALTQANGAVWVIGGASVYRAALAHADRVVVTELQESFDGDVCAPTLGPRWCAEAPTDWQQSSTGLHYRFVVHTQAR